MQGCQGPDQATVEAFYRLRLTPNVRLCGRSPDQGVWLRAVGILDARRLR